jgi:hypothetical protein
MTAVILAVMTILKLVSAWFDTFSYVVIIVAVLIWPITMLIYQKHFNSSQKGKAPVKLSLFIWVALSVVMLLSNYFTSHRIDWAIYPIIGITLFPIAMLLYNFLQKHLVDDRR